METPELEPTANTFGAVGFGAVDNYAWFGVTDRFPDVIGKDFGFDAWVHRLEPFCGRAFDVFDQPVHLAVTSRGSIDVVFGGVTLLGATKDLLPAQPDRGALSAVGTAIPSRRRVPPWFDSTVARMNALMTLSSGWNGYDSAPIEPRAIRAAMEAMLALDRDTRLMPSIVPTHESGIQLEWHLGGVDLEAEFLPDGHVELWYSDGQTGQEREERIESGDEAIRQLDALLTVIETRL